MSRIGKHPINIPSGVKASLEAGVFIAQSPKGEFRFSVPVGINISLDESKIVVSIADGDDKKLRQFWGTTRAIVNNGVIGLVNPFQQRVELVGVGYRASVQGKNLVLQLGYSHDIIKIIPEGLSVACEKPTTILVSGHDKKEVGQFIRELQNFRKPEPYKGKGVIREGQYVIRKEGKKK